MEDETIIGEALPTRGRTKSVMNAIRSRIAQRTLAPGDRLPSIRAFAAINGVSPATVVEAYDRLVAEGLIQARKGSGFYVAQATMPPLRLGVEAPARIRAVDPFFVSRQSLDSADDGLKPGCGWLPTDWLPQEALKKALRTVARNGGSTLTDYGPTLGSPALRRLILARLADGGIEAGPENAILSGSGTQALDLICRMLLRPGDTVLINDPCYFNFRALLKVHQVKTVAVPYTPAGPDMEVFAEVLERAKPRLYLTNSALHNPTGATLSPQVAHRILKLSAQHDVTIVEDDIFGDLEPDPSVRLSALDGLDRVIRIGSHSKTLSAALRCGSIAARADFIEALADLQIATNFGGPSPVAAETLALVLSSGNYRRHVDDLRGRLVKARREATDLLSAIGIMPWLTPRGGFYLWCTLPDGIDSTLLAERAIAEGLLLAPGNIFSLTQRCSRFMRFNVAHLDRSVISAIERLMATMR